MNPPAKNATPPIPIFVISYNRGPLLLRAVQSFRRQNRPTEFIVHDNGSDDFETIAILAKLERQGVAVFRRSKICAPSELDLVNETVAEYFRDRAALGSYVVTDCDIDLTEAHPDAIAVYEELLEDFPTAACVGPMLKIADISQTYPLFNHVMNRHIEQFWNQEPKWATTSFGRVAYIEAPIDTTFAVHREGATFCRLKDGLRVYFPYEARHLDWHLDAHAADPYRFTSSSEISHWNNQAYHLSHAQDCLRYDRYIVVERDCGGELASCVKTPTADNPP